MTFSTDDLAQLFVAPQREHTGYGQGVLTAWNPDTFENAVSYRGATLTNLPVMDRVGALTYQPGDVVLLMRWTPSGGGLSSYWIAGSPVIPAAGAAEQAIAFMTTTLAAAIQRNVIAGGIRADTNAGQTTTTSTTFGDGTDAGPTLTDVVVSELGLCLVLWGAGTDAGPRNGGQVGGYMGLQISGATSISPSTGTAAHVGQSVTVTSGTVTHRAQARTMASQVFALNPGTHTIAAKYASQVSGQSVALTGRTIIAIPF